MSRDCTACGDQLEGSECQSCIVWREENDAKIAKLEAEVAQIPPLKFLLCKVVPYVADMKTKAAIRGDRFSEELWQKWLDEAGPHVLSLLNPSSERSEPPKEGE